MGTVLINLVKQLHDAGKPSSPPIAPVTYMWRPMQQIITKVEEPSSEVTSGVMEQQPNMDKSTFNRKLWLWIHPASFKEAYASLSLACENSVG